MAAEARARIEAGMDTESFYSAILDLVRSLEDEHSYFDSPLAAAREEAHLAGIKRVVGIGVHVQPILDKSRAVVLLVWSDSPAEHAGLRPHDALLAVDGLPLVEPDAAYPQRLRGPECSAVVLRVQSPGGEKRDVTLFRDQIRGSLAIQSKPVPTSDGSRIGYIFLPSFFDDTLPGQVESALQNFGALDGLILDHLMNVGGSGAVVPTLSGTLSSLKPPPRWRRHWRC